MWARAMNIFTNCERTDERTNSISDYSANPRVVQFRYSLTTFKNGIYYLASIPGQRGWYERKFHLCNPPLSTPWPCEDIWSCWELHLVSPSALFDSPHSVCKQTSYGGDLCEDDPCCQCNQYSVWALFWCYQGLAEPSSAMVHCTTPWSKPFSDTFDVDDVGNARLAWVPVWSFFLLLFLFFCFLVKNVNINRNH